MASVLDAASLARTRYSTVAILLHWTIAALIVANLFLGIFHDDFGKAAGSRMIFFHKSFGLTVLFLSVARLAWRLVHRPPPFDPVLAGWEVAAARAAHWLFYGLMITVPLTGWVMSSAEGHPTSFYGVFQMWTLPVAHSHQSHEFWETAHGLLGYATLALLVLHIAGVLKHVFDGHGRVVGRMAPWLYRTS